MNGPRRTHRYFHEKGSFHRRHFSYLFKSAMSISDRDRAAHSAVLHRVKRNIGTEMFDKMINTPRVILNIRLRNNSRGNLLYVCELNRRVLR